MYHSVMSCLRLLGPSCHTSLGACSCSLSTSCSSEAHFHVGSERGRLGVKSHITRVMKIDWIVCVDALPDEVQAAPVAVVEG